MPGYIIHLAVASEYMKKHENEIKNKEEFFNGTLEPDFNNNKWISHYENWGDNKVGVGKFFEINDIDVTTDFGKGYLLHLIVDEAFYNNYFCKLTDYLRDNKLDLYKDYDCTNKQILEKFNIEYIPKRAKKEIKYADIKKEKPKFLELEKVIDFINKITEYSLEEQTNSIKSKNKVLI